ncbi:MFS transporter [Natronomonas halophila]|uniref:MFS transporter n=1 Tax=Natronomonas halophila TaxID=2747817 RepID=UPI0015B3F22C|nr:MFS transporter [Natronomonas halophila]QLD86590.1 MFS transporter [Natronomonas halophila]
MSENSRTVRLYYAYRATTANGFWIPYAYVYLLELGFGEATFGFANAAFLFTMVAAEIPAGYVGDRLGRRVSLGAGNLLATVVFGLHASVGSTPQVVALFAVWGVGYAFHSAAGEAWLYDLLDGRDDGTDEFARVSGRSETASLLASAGGALAATPLYWVDPALPFLANALLSAVGIAVLAALPATRGDEETTFSVRRAVRMLRVQAGRPEVRWLVVYTALFNLLLSMTRWLEQPALKAAGVPLAGFGALYASFQLVSAAGTWTTGWLQDSLGAKRFFLLLAPLVGVAYGLVAVVPAFVVPVVYLRRVLARVVGPLRDQYLNDRFDGFSRATMLSGVSMTLTLASGVSAAVFGPVAEAMGPLSFLPRAGIVVASLAALLWVGTNPVRLRSESGAVAGSRADD